MGSNPAYMKFPFSAGFLFETVLVASIAAMVSHTFNCLILFQSEIYSAFAYSFGTKIFSMVLRNFKVIEATVIRLEEWIYRKYLPNCFLSGPKK